MNPKRPLDLDTTGNPVPFPTTGDIDRHLMRSRQLRAEATRALLAGLGHRTARPIRHLAAPLVRRRRRQKTSDLLMRCSDRVLADIGIEREHIPLIAGGLDPHGPEPAPRGLLRWWRRVRTRRAVLRQARREWRRVYQELMAYDDRELDEIGIRRVDIPVILSGRTPAPAFT